ncbi:hypothetical protein GW17_00054567 [Ensete ventricosum]|nr:hypothetical protein GW17_00054567 [Ensete ventricosum]
MPLQPHVLRTSRPYLEGRLREAGVKDRHPRDDSRDTPIELLVEDPRGSINPQEVSTPPTLADLRTRTRTGRADTSARLMKVSAHIKKRTDQDLAARCAPRLSNGSNRDVCCSVEGYVREARRSTRSQTSRWPRGAEPLGLGDTEAKESASCRHRFPGLVRARAQCRPREDNWTVRFPSAQPSLPPPAFCLSLGSSAPFLPGFKIGIYRVSDRRGGSPPGAMSCLHDHSCEDHNCSADWSLHTHIDLSKVVDGI